MTALPLLLDDRAAAVEALHTATALYTATPIVDALLDRIEWPHRPGRLLDPCAGDGIFIDRALRRLLACGAGRTEIAARLHAWEFHPGATADARRRIASTLTEAGIPKAYELATSIIQERDFLTDGPSERFEAISTNPPYTRFSHLPPLLRIEYEAVTPDFAQGDMLHAFLDRCAALLTDDGCIAAVTADRWLFTAGAARLRERLGRSLGISHLTRLDPSTSFYRPKYRRTGTPPRVHPVEVLLHRAGSAHIALSRAPIFPDAPSDEVSAHCLEDLATVRLAPWLGTPGIFVVDAAAAATLPDEELVPAIDTENFRTDNTIAPPTHFAIRTLRERQPSDAVMAHLERHMPRMCARGRRTTGPTWLPPEQWTSVFPLQTQALLVPRIAKELRILRLPAGTVPINHNITVIVATDRLDAIEAALRSPAAKAWVAARAHRLEHGYLSILPTLLRKLPISIENTTPVAAEPSSPHTIP